MTPDKPQDNRLLAALTDAEWRRWLPLLERVELPLARTLHEPGEPVERVYFPTSAVVSLLTVGDDGTPGQMAVVGPEGLVGISVFMGGGVARQRAVVQSAGMAWRMPSGLLKAELARSDAAVWLMLRYTQALITQMSQTAACQRHHSTDQQLCRWLLLLMDRLPGNEVVMTQEMLAHMLVAPLEQVMEAALALQLAGLLRYTRGRLSHLDRAGLERCSCACYGVVKTEYDRLLPDPTPR